MNQIMQIKQKLTEIPALMRELSLWQMTSPDSTRLASTEPFGIDMLAAEEWLQWVFLPQMWALLEAKQPLPKDCSLAPYFTEALKYHPVDAIKLITLLGQIDQLLTQ